MNTQQALQHVESGVPERRQPSVADMLQAVVEKGITAENVGAMEKLVGLYERMQEREAEKEFSRALAALQNEMPVIVAKTVIPNRGKYERFEDVMVVLNPLLSKHGFSVTFSNEWKESRVTETCTLSHVGGHSRSNSFTVRVSRADSETQADCKAATTAKRNALLNALNIVIRQDCLQNEDDDPRLSGDLVSEDQAEELLRRVIESDSSAPAFLKFCGVTSEKAGLDEFRKIPASRYDSADQMLRRKESKGR